MSRELRSCDFLPSVSYRRLFSERFSPSNRPCQRSVCNHCLCNVVLLHPPRPLPHLRIWLRRQLCAPYTNPKTNPICCLIIILGSGPLPTYRSFPAYLSTCRSFLRGCASSVVGSGLPCRTSWMSCTLEICALPVDV